MKWNNDICLESAGIPETAKCLMIFYVSFGLSLSLPKRLFLLAGNFVYFFLFLFPPKFRNSWSWKKLDKKSFCPIKQTKKKSSAATQLFGLPVSFSNYMIRDSCLELLIHRGFCKDKYFVASQWQWKPENWIETRHFKMLILTQQKFLIHKHFFNL